MKYYCFKDLLKHTNKNNLDHSALDKAIDGIKKVLTCINEDKRKTESQMLLFDIFNEIDNCPAQLVSSHRTFIGKCDVVERDGIHGRGDNLVLFLFNDTLEMCKKRSKAYNSSKSPSTVNGLHNLRMQCKPYKHIRMISLSAVKKVINIRESEGNKKFSSFDMIFFISNHFAYFRLMVLVIIFVKIHENCMDETNVFRGTQFIRHHRSA